MMGNTGERALQIDHVQTFCALSLPDQSHTDRIVGVNGLPSKISLDKTHASAFFQIYCRNDNHEEPSLKDDENPVVKLPARSAGLPGKEEICLLGGAYGLKLPVTEMMRRAGHLEAPDVVTAGRERS
jgi:hypothetical protein